jgi:peptidase E
MTPMVAAAADRLKLFGKANPLEKIRAVRSGAATARSQQRRRKLIMSCDGD